MKAAPERGARDIASTILRRGPLSFRDFMAAALHDPTSGYYSRGPGRLGPEGDFITSPEISAGFGACIARQIAEMDRLLGRPDPFALVELGAGGGRLAADLVRAFATDPRAGELSKRLSLILVESSPGMRQAALERLRDEPGARGVAAFPTIEEAVAEAGGPVTGAFVSNEFYDALPVHWVVRKRGTLHEVFVGLAADGDPDDAPSPRFERLLRPVTDPEITAYASRYGIAAGEGSEGEVGLDAQRLMREAARALRKGFHLTVDYGDEAEGLAARPLGTILAYRGHRTSEEVLDRPGEQDLTAHVNFTALADAGEAEGLALTGRTSQMRFLLALGLADDIAALAGRDDARSIRRRLALSSLIHPEGMGRTFSVLIQHKSVAAPALAGLADPFASGESE